MTAFRLARWFQPERYANRPEDDFVRDEILNDLYDATKVAVGADGEVFVETPNGACSIRQEPGNLVVFDYVSNVRWERTSFWMNASSVSGLGDVFRGLPRAPVDEIFTGAVS